VSHRNNFDLLRFVFAAMVFLVHTHVLSGQPALAPLSTYFSSDVGVKAFFVVSGFLVLMSYERSATVGEYAGKRVRRIYPAYATVVIACAVLGILLSNVPPTEYLNGAGRYLLANLAFLNFLAPTLPGVFTNNAWPEVNGLLWTLKIEVMFYASVPIIAWIAARFGRAATLATLYALSVAYLATMTRAAESTGSGFLLQLSRQLPGQLAYFVAGAAAYYFVDSLDRRWPLLLAAAVAAYAAIRLGIPRDLQFALEPAALAVLVVYAAIGLRYLGNFGRWGDFSYGIYIIHFPVVQTLVAVGVFARDPWLGFAVAAFAVLALAALCWHFVERPFLRRNSHYVLAEAGRT